jgi:hypothetical protein
MRRGRKGNISGDEEIPGGCLSKNQMDSRSVRNRDSRYLNDRIDDNRRDEDRRGRRGEYERDYRDRRSRSRERHREPKSRDNRRNSRSRGREDQDSSETRTRDEILHGRRNRSDHRDDRRSPRDNYADRKGDPKDDQHQHRPHSHSNSHANRYDLPTTESLHAKKLAALDHENFLINRQKERLAKVKVEGLWPKTPPRAEFYFGDVIVLNVVEAEVGAEAEAEEDENLNVNEVVGDTEPVDKVVVVDGEDYSDEVLEMNIKVKAPSATKPSINSFSTSKPTRYGGDLMPGEGTAMAGFISQGQRIPRRGEIGLDSNQISRFESAGYVMSGSRHHLMNAVRMRKENQVISAEEKRMISQMALEERVKREEEIVRTFKSMVEEKMKQQQKK